MDALAPGQIALKVHGTRRPTGMSERVPATTFARKLTFLVRALRAADAVANGKVIHDYTIEKLQSSSPTVILQEEPIVRRNKGPTYGTSATDAFDACVSAINLGNVEVARKYGRVPDLVSRLASGAGREFGYGELWINGHSLIRLDSLLAEQARTAVEFAAEPEPQRWFKGQVQGSFDGRVKEVDLRGALPQVKIVISGTSKEIDCILRGYDVEQIREVLDRRVRVEGVAFYDGKSGLPRRIEVRPGAITPIRTDVDFTKWRGSFAPFDPPWANEE